MADEMNPQQRFAMHVVMNEVENERYRQHAKWGEQNHPNGTGDYADDLTAQDIEYIAAATSEPGHREAMTPGAAMAEAAKFIVDYASKNKVVTHAQILTEEFFEALAESDPLKLRAELIQVAAVAVQWIECIDRSTK